MHVECIPNNTWSRNEVGSSRSACFIHFVHVGATFCILPAIVMSFTWFYYNKPCFRWTQRHSQRHKRPASGCPCKFRSRGTTGSSIVWPRFWPLLSWKTYPYIYTCGHCDFRIPSNFGASFIFTCMLIRRQLLVHHSQEVLQWHPLLLRLLAETHTSRAQHRPQRPQTRLLQCHSEYDFWFFGCNSAFLRWQMSIHVEKWTFFLSLCAPRVTSFLLLTWSICQAGIVSSFTHSLSIEASAARIVIAGGMGINTWTKLKCAIELCPLLAGCGLHDLLVEMIPNVVSWTHELPRYIFWETNWESEVQHVTWGCIGNDTRTNWQQQQHTEAKCDGRSMSDLVDVLRWVWLRGATCEDDSEVSAMETEYGTTSPSQTCGYVAMMTFLHTYTLSVLQNMVEGGRRDEDPEGEDDGFVWGETGDWIGERGVMGRWDDGVVFCLMWKKWNGTGVIGIRMYSMCDSGFSMWQSRSLTGWIQVKSPGRMVELKERDDGWEEREWTQNKWRDKKEADAAEREKADCQIHGGGEINKRKKAPGGTKGE